MLVNEQVCLSASREASVSEPGAVADGIILSSCALIGSLPLAVLTQRCARTSELTRAARINLRRRNIPNIREPGPITCSTASNATPRTAAGDGPYACTSRRPTLGTRAGQTKGERAHSLHVAPMRSTSDTSSERIASTGAASATSSSGAVGAPFGNGTTCRIRCLIGNT